MKMSFAAITAIVLMTTSIAADPAYSKGDAKRGEELAKPCRACHGRDGNSPSPTFPRIGGQHEQYIYRTLKAYRDGKRPDAIMQAPVIDMPDQDMKDIAAFYAKQMGLTGSQGDTQVIDQSKPSRIVQYDDKMPMYTTLLGKARQIEKDIAGDLERLGAPKCALSGSADGDADRDGLPDKFDAAPNNSGEFVGDTNGDGRYEICNAEQFQAILTLGDGDGKSTTLSLDERMRRDYQIAADLDLSGFENFQPIGNCGEKNNCMMTLDKYAFQGVMDGQGYTISNLNIDRPETGGTGLIGVLGREGVLMNLTLKDADVVGKGGTAMAVGANFGIIYKVRTGGTVTGSNAVGGVAGGSAGLIVDSHANSTIRGEKALGGLVGDMNGAVFYGTAISDVAGEWGLGGLVGLNTYGTVLSSHAEGTVNGDVNVGGLVGINTDGVVFNNYSKSNVEAKTRSAGGIAGFNSLGTIHSSYAAGTIKGAESVGGLAGTNNGAIRNSLALGQVSGEVAVGGVSGTRSGGNESGSYWNEELTKQANAVGAYGEGAKPNDDVIEALGIATSQLKSLDGESIGWTPAEAPKDLLLAYYCDANKNGWIDIGERRPDNFVWDFGSGGAYPDIRCVPPAQ